MSLDYTQTGPGKQNPSQASAEFVSTAPEGVVFGFNATRMRIVNDRSSPVYLSFGSSVGSTAAGFRTCAGETAIDGPCPPCAQVGIASTTTSTGTVRVAAWG